MAYTLLHCDLSSEAPIPGGDVLTLSRYRAAALV